MTLLVNCIAHLLVDGVCAAAIFGGLAESGSLVVPALVYNTLAFATQGLVGLATDRLKRHEWITSTACILVAAGFFLPLSDLFKVVVIGVGNSLFHVGGGTTTLLASRGKAWKLGLFVAPGSVGLALGTAFPVLGADFAAALFVCAVLMVTVARPRPELMEEIGAVERPDAPLWVPLVLLAAVAVRAIGGTAVSFSWNDTVLLGLATVFSVFSGKALGGFAVDRFGVRRTALLTIPVAALLIAFGSQWMAPSLLGQFLLNLTMPVTLFLMYRALPNAPGFAFGLTASALWPGTLAGKLLVLTGPALWACVLASFGLGLAAILLAYRNLKEKDGTLK